MQSQVYSENSVGLSTQPCGEPAESGDRGELGTKFTVGNLLERPVSRKG